MTPERAAYHYLMLSVGQREEFDRDFDEALEREDPLSDLTVQLCAAPPSDINACRSVLMNYYADHAVDGDMVYDLVWQDLRRRWQSGMPDAELANLAWAIQAEAQDCWEADWEELRELSYALEYWMESTITEERFRWCLQEYFTTKICPDPLPPVPVRKSLLQRLNDALK